MANQAGRSARAEYERRSERDRANRPRVSHAIFRVLLLAFGTYVAVHLAVDALNHALEGLEKAGRVTATGAAPAFRGGLANEFGLLFAMLVGAFTAIRIWAPRQSTVAWRQGAEGEERLGHHLDQLTVTASSSSTTDECLGRRQISTIWLSDPPECSSSTRRTSVTSSPWARALSGRVSIP